MICLLELNFLMCIKAFIRLGFRGNRHSGQFSKEAIEGGLSQTLPDLRPEHRFSGEEEGP